MKLKHNEVLSFTKKADPQIMINETVEEFRLMLQSYFDLIEPYFERSTNLYLFYKVKFDLTREKNYS